MFKVKNTNMHATYKLETQISIRFALWWAVLELRPNFGKSITNDLDMLKVKGTHMHTAYTPEA